MPLRKAPPGVLLVLLVVAALLWAIPGTTPAAVTPLTLIERQVIKPNMLFLFDVSVSMIGAPGENDADMNEVGVDCDDGLDCRTVGAVGRCFYSSGGAMGAGVRGDNTSCHTDAECRVGYCKNNYPADCDKDSDCPTGIKCKGFRNNAPSTACTGDGSGYTCRGICNITTPVPKCTSDADCNTGIGDVCTVFPDDVCILSGTAAVSKMCAIAMTRCRSDADCPTTGDYCGPAKSRMVIAKRVVSNIVASYYTSVNFGLMTFYQSGYYPYYPVSGSIVDNTITRFMDRDELQTLGCWNKNTGPTTTCTIAGQNHNRRNNPDTRYRVRTGASTYSSVDVNWCGNWCTLPGGEGTGHYVGSYFTYTDPLAAPAARTCDSAADCYAGESCCTGGGYDKCCRVEPTYKGKTLTVGTTKYVYWDPPVDHRNMNNVYGDQRYPLDISGGSGDGTCCATCGGRADSTVAPFMDTSNNTATAKTMALAIMAKMEKASLGGLGMGGYTPTGCALGFGTSTAKTDFNNAHSYLAKVKSTDSLSCRNNYVLLITDGAPNRGYDANCDSAACSATPPTSSCTCRAVMAAKEMKAVDIKTFVVGFSRDSAAQYPRDTLNNIAKAGGTGAAFFAVSEDELRNAIVAAIYEAAKGSYSTAPASGSSGTQNAAGAITQGTLVLDTRVDFPGWKGNLIAYDTATTPPSVKWNAATVSFDYNVTTGKYFTTTAPVDRRGDWKKRNVWTSEGTTMVKITVDQTTGAITNKATLKTLGLGATDAEAEKVARWILGDPAMGNPAVLGAILNSTPIDVGPAGKSSLPGGDAFFTATSSRPFLTYVGSSDGMIHAFFTKDTTVGTTTYNAGQEAFAYIPQTMLAVALKLYSQGGQMPDPKDHVYGLANSAKVKNLCVANCTDAAAAQWKTHLIMTFGWGGTEAFLLDITNPFDGGGVKTTTAPAPLLWSTQYLASSSTSAYDNALGLTTSVPAFYYAKSATRDDFRVVFGSYTTDPTTGSLAKVLLNASAKTGAITDAETITPGNSCTQLFGLMSDVATARNFAATEEDQIAAAYFGDTWGNLYRYVPTVGTSNYTGTTGVSTQIEAMTCNHPVHYAPAIIQLDRENASNGPGDVYIVQVTNSALDMATKDYPASKVVFRRDKISTTGAVTSDGTFGTAGRLELTVGTAAMCGVGDGVTCSEILPASARPNATPVGVIRADGGGFQAIATWYVPAVDGCVDGQTYLTVHEYTTASGGVLKQRFATKLAGEPVTSVVFVGGKMMFARQGEIVDLTGMLPSGVKYANIVPGERFRRTGWSERP